jgi:hypothetical protein
MTGLAGSQLMSHTHPVGGSDGLAATTHLGERNRHSTETHETSEQQEHLCYWLKYRDVSRGSDRRSTPHSASIGVRTATPIRGSKSGFTPPDDREYPVENRSSR